MQKGFNTLHGEKPLFLSGIFNPSEFDSNPAPVLVRHAWSAREIKHDVKSRMMSLFFRQVAALRDDQRSQRMDSSTFNVLDWPKMSLCMLHWQVEPWSRLRDMPCVLADDPFNRQESWWRKASRVLRGF